MSSIIQTTCGNTVTSKRARYQTLLRCLQGTASCLLNLITFLVNLTGEIQNPDHARSRLTFLRKDQESYNIFFRNLTKAFPETNISQVIELAVTTNIVLCSLEHDVCPPYLDGTFVREPIFALYQFLLRICDEKPILVMVADNAHGAHCSHIQELLEHFIAEQIRLKQTVFELPS